LESGDPQSVKKKKLIFDPPEVNFRFRFFAENLNSSFDLVFDFGLSRVANVIERVAYYLNGPVIAKQKSPMSPHGLISPIKWRKAQSNFAISIKDAVLFHRKLL
jgi:hypothetical protein